MTLLASKCVDGAAQRALSLAKCVNKVAQWGFRWSMSLLAGCGSSHHSALLELRRQGGGEWQIRFGGIWCGLDRGNQEIPLDGWLPLTYATNTSPATYMARGGNIFQLRSAIRGLRSAINGFWRQALNSYGNLSSCCESPAKLIELSLLCWFRFSVFCLPISFHKPLYWKNDILSSLPKRVICHLFSWRFYISTFTCIYMYTMFFL